MKNHLLNLIRSHAKRIALLGVLAGACSPLAAQLTVTKYSGASGGSLSNTLQGDLQVANGRTLTISTNGSLIVGPGATVSISGATLTGSFSLSNVDILGGTATFSSLTVSGTATLSTATVSTGTIGTATIISGSATLSSLTVSGTANISTATMSTETVSNSWRATSPTGGFGYGAGSGSTSTQLTNKSTAVTINAVSGQITLNSASLSSAGTVSFTLTNSAIAATDVIFANASSASYSARATNGGTGTTLFTITNQSGVTASDSPVITFIVIKASSN